MIVGGSKINVWGETQGPEPRTAVPAVTSLQRRFHLSSVPGADLLGGLDQINPNSESTLFIAARASGKRNKSVSSSLATLFGGGGGATRSRAGASDSLFWFFLRENESEPENEPPLARGSAFCSITT